MRRLWMAWFSGIVLILLGLSAAFWGAAHLCGEERPVQPFLAGRYYAGLQTLECNTLAGPVGESVKDGGAFYLAMDGRERSQTYQFKGLIFLSWTEAEAYSAQRSFFQRKDPAMPTPDTVEFTGTSSSISEELLEEILQFYSENLNTSFKINRRNASKYIGENYLNTVQPPRRNTNHASMAMAGSFYLLATGCLLLMARRNKSGEEYPPLWVLGRGRVSGWLAKALYLMALLELAVWTAACVLNRDAIHALDEAELTFLDAAGMSKALPLFICMFGMLFLLWVMCWHASPYYPFLLSRGFYCLVESEKWTEFFIATGRKRDNSDRTRKEDRHKMAFPGLAAYLIFLFSWIAVLAVVPAGLILGSVHADAAVQYTLRRAFECLFFSQFGLLFVFLFYQLDFALGTARNL